MKIQLLIISIFIVYSFSSAGQPVLNKKESMNDITYYPDLKDKNLFYYPPGILWLGTDNFGAPELKFLQMRYTGTQATGDQGKINYKSILQFTVRMKNTGAEQLRELKTILESKTRSPVQLRPMPIRKMEAMLVYASAGENNAGNDKAQLIHGGNLENTDAENENRDFGEYWNERTFTISLDKYTSQIFWNALEKGQMAMSLAFAFFVEGVNPTESIIHIAASGEISDEMKKQITEFAADSLADSTGKTTLFKADAFGISVDVKKYPDLIKKIDINEAFTPPDFAVLEVRCYDFNNQLRDDLYAKRIEVEATAMNGNPVKQKVTFYTSEPDIYYSGIRFKYAVKMDKPFRYRVIEIKNDTDPHYGNWITEKNWTKIIDITTKK